MQLTLNLMLYLDEITLYIKEKYALDVNPSIVSHLLKAKGLSKKVVSHLPLRFSASTFFYLCILQESTHYHHSCKSELLSATKSFETIGQATLRTGQLVKCSFLMSLQLMNIHLTTERAGLLVEAHPTKHFHLNGLSVRVSCCVMIAGDSSAMT